MTNTGTNWNVIGEPVRADAYYGDTDVILAVQVSDQNFVGCFGVQVALAWIKLHPNGDVNTPFIPFPIDPYAPTGQNGGDTGSLATTFIGNFVFLRAVLTREYIQPPPVNPAWQTWQWGQIDKVLLSL